MAYRAKLSAAFVDELTDLVRRTRVLNVMLADNIMEPGYLRDALPRLGPVRLLRAEGEPDHRAEYPGGGRPVGRAVRGPGRRDRRRGRPAFRQLLGELTRAGLAIRLGGRYHVPPSR